MNNPYRPGSGHMPVYLAGREDEKQEFKSLLQQEIIMKNLIITGLRGIGKTVLLQSLKPVATDEGWWWIGTDCAESTSVSEATMAIRILTDLSVITSSIEIGQTQTPSLGFIDNSDKQVIKLDYDNLIALYERQPGLVADKLKRVLTIAWDYLKEIQIKGVVFAYDEAQTLGDHDKEHQYPLSLLLDVFNFLQKESIPFLLVLTGLPILITKLVETRTYSERLFKVITLDRLNEQESRDAILKPLEIEGQQARMDLQTIDLIVKLSGGYPYFIQFFCREVYDLIIQQLSSGEVIQVPVNSIVKKLDNDFFAARWAKATDRERDLLVAVAKEGLDNFTVSEAVKATSKHCDMKFSPSYVHQIFTKLIQQSLIYKDRRGKYTFAVPLMGQFIIRQTT